MLSRRNLLTDSSQWRWCHGLTCGTPVSAAGTSLAHDGSSVSEATEPTRSESANCHDHWLETAPSQLTMDADIVNNNALCLSATVIRRNLNQQPWVKEPSLFQVPALVRPSQRSSLSPFPFPSPRAMQLHVPLHRLQLRVVLAVNLRCLGRHCPLVSLHCASS